MKTSPKARSIPDPRLIRDELSEQKKLVKRERELNALTLTVVGSPLEDFMDLPTEIDQSLTVQPAKHEWRSELEALPSWLRRPNR